MAKLTFTEDELLAEHDHATAHVVGRQRLHGGFAAEGAYQPPRSLVRNEAIDAWSAALRDRGGDLLDADSSLLSGPRLPNLAQQLLLLRNDLGQTFWNQLTVTGKIEARGRVLADMSFPDLRDHVAVSAEGFDQMAIGHLNRGLLVAHGLDEGGQPELGIGGHDEMWFAARDLVFGADAFADVDPPERIGRPEAPAAVMPEIPREIESFLSFLMNLLIIEFRAEIGFALTQQVLRTDDVFPDRRAAADEAAEIIERIRIDERIHVTSLRLYLGELRSVDLVRAGEPGTIGGAVLIDRLWDDLVRWATVEQPPLAAAQQLAEIEPRIAVHSNGDRILAEFRSLADRGVPLGDADRSQTAQPTGANR